MRSAFLREREPSMDKIIRDFEVSPHDDGDHLAVAGCPVLGAALVVAPLARTPYQATGATTRVAATVARRSVGFAALNPPYR
jgi:hypothetical protein